MGVVRNVRAAPPPDLRIGTLQTIDSLNPYMGINDPSYLLYGLIYDYPYAFDQDGNWIPNLITSASCAVANCTVWNYTVRQGVTWSDGTPLTPADVAFTWNYDSQNLAKLWAYEPYFNQVVQCSPPKVTTKCGAAVLPANGWNVTVYFKRPFAAGKDLFGPIVQKAQWQSISPASAGTNYNNPNPIGTGPFIADPNIYSEFQQLPAVPLHLFKNPNYHQVGSSVPNIQIANIYIYEFSDPTSLALAIQRGDIDTAAFTTQTIGQVRNKSNILVQSAIQAIQEWDEVGITQCDTPASGGLNPARFDTAVRIALAKATNKDYIVQNIYDGQGIRGDSLVSPVTPAWWYDPVAGGDNLTFDINAAKAILAADGWTGSWSDSTGTYRSNPNPITVSYQSSYNMYQVEDVPNKTITIPAGTHLSFTLAVRPPSEFPEELTTAQYLLEQWAQIGVKVTINQESTENALQSDVYGCKVEMYIWYWSSDPDPNYMLSMESSWTLDGWNDNYWVNTTYNQYYLKQLADLDPATREADAKYAQKIQYESASYIIFIYPYGEWAMRTDLWQGWGDWTAHPYRQLNAYWGANPLFFDLNCPTCSAASTNQPPTRPVIQTNTPYLSAYTNQTRTLTATSSDAETTDQLNWTWNWGDGTSTVTQGTAANPTSTASHFWNTTGNFTVTVTVSDGWNAPVASQSPVYMLVTNPPAGLGSIRGNVKDPGGAPIAGAQVLAQPGSNFDTTASDGTYTISLPAGTYNVTASAYLYGDRTQSNVAVLASQTTWANFTLVPSVGWIVGNVTNLATGSPIAGAVVLVTSSSSQQTTASTNSQGRFNISVEPGAYTVNVTATGYYGAQQTVSVASGAESVATFRLTAIPTTTPGLEPLVIAAIAAVVIIAAVAVVAVLMMRRRRKKEDEEGKLNLPPKT